MSGIARTDSVCKLCPHKNVDGRRKGTLRTSVQHLDSKYPILGPPVASATRAVSWIERVVGCVLSVALFDNSSRECSRLQCS